MRPRVQRVRRQAAERGRSLNEWVSTVLDAASDPSHAGAEAEQVRERLARAGLLAPVTMQTPIAGVDPGRLAAARAAAGRGVSLSELVAQGRD